MFLIHTNSQYYNLHNFEYSDLKCNASYCDKKLGHCVHGDFNHCIEKPFDEPKVKMHVRLSVWMEDTCQEEEEEVTKIIEPGNVSHLMYPCGRLIIIDQ